MPHNHASEIRSTPREGWYPHAKIVATIGPASDSPEMIMRLIKAGVSIFRLNFSHGAMDEHFERLQRIRAAAKAYGRPTAILGDISGPKIRVTKVPDISEDGGIVVEAGQDVIFRDGVATAFLENGTPVFGVTLDRVLHDVASGQRVLINDGAIRMLAVSTDPGKELVCRVTYGGKISSGKGINLPETFLNTPAITKHDWACVEWAVEHGVDLLALSFVRTADEVRELTSRLAGMCSTHQENSDHSVGLQIPVISKIEMPEAVKNIDSIIEASDGIMVARGDLGVEMDLAQVPVIQKYLIARAKQLGKPVIVATQMLETMVESPSPTRAEASDVANAIFDGTDAVMLSAETAVGKHPELVVETMDRIIRIVESRVRDLPMEHYKPDLIELPHRSAALAHGVWHMAKDLDSKVVAVWSQAGGMARYLSQNRFRAMIYAYSSSLIACRRMTVLHGVQPRLAEPPVSGRLRDWTDMVEADLLARGLVVHGDPVILIAGKPLGGTSAQDSLSILRVGDAQSGFRVPKSVID